MKETYVKDVSPPARCTARYVPSSSSRACHARRKEFIGSRRGILRCILLQELFIVASLPDQKNEVDDESPLKKPIQMQCFVSEHFLVFFLDDGMYYGSILF